MASGKSEIASKIISTFAPYEVQKVSLGDAVKAQIVQYGLTPDFAINKFRDRAILQSYGQFRRGEIREFNFHNGRAKLRPNSHGKDESFLEVNGSSVFVGFSYPNYWIDILAPTINNFKSVDIPIVNDDIRRMNEYLAFKNWGFTIVKIESSEEIRIHRLIKRDSNYDVTRMEDISEREIDILPYDILIQNNDTIDKAWNTLLSSLD